MKRWKAEILLFTIVVAGWTASLGVNYYIKHYPFRKFVWHPKPWLPDDLYLVWYCDNAPVSACPPGQFIILVRNEEGLRTCLEFVGPGEHICVFTGEQRIFVEQSRLPQ